MKICVIGSGATGLAAAKRFYDLGAHVCVFHKTKEGGFAKVIGDHIADHDLAEHWKQLHTRPSLELKKGAEELNLLRPAEVLRVHKRVLKKNEEAKTGSRLSDLFRVVFQAEFSEELKEQVANNPEVFSKLDQHTLNSLNGTLENFDDFDIVINATGTKHNPLKAGPSGVAALNENRANIFYGTEALKKSFSLDKEKKIMIVGSGMMATVAMLNLRHWLESNPEHELHVTTTEMPPFEKMGKEWPLLKTKLDQMIEQYFQIWQKKNEEYRSAIHEWRSLEDHIRAKIHAPKEPTSQLMIRPERQVMAFDILSDREGQFVTIESTTDLETLETVVCDTVLCFTGHESNPLIDASLRVQRGYKEENLIQPEPGYYLLSHTDQLDELERDVLQFFSKVTE